MPFVSGFLRVRRRGRPDQGLPGEGDGPVDPDYGVDEGEMPEVEPPDPPAGIWPPLTPEHPWRPIPPRPEFPERPERPERPESPERPGQGLPPSVQPPAGGIGGRPPARPSPGPGGDEHPDTGFPPGAIWPPLPPGVHGKYLALVLVAGMPGVKYRYVVIDADARPEPPAGGIGGRPPARPHPPGEPEVDPTQR